MSSNGMHFAVSASALMSPDILLTIEPLIMNFCIRDIGANDDSLFVGTNDTYRAFETSAINEDSTVLPFVTTSATTMPFLPWLF